MTSRIPLIVNSSTGQIDEIQAGDNLSLPLNNIVDVQNISALGNVSTLGIYTDGYFFANGTPVPFGNGGGTNYSNANVVSLLDSGLAGNIIPAADNTYSLGNLTHQWASVYVGANTIYIDGNPLSGNTSDITYNGHPLAIISAAPVDFVSNVTTNAAIISNSVITGDITGDSMTLNSNGYITFGDGTTQYTAAIPYGNANVAAYLPTYSGNIANLNITGQLTAPTLSDSDNSSNVATTAFVQNVVVAIGGYGNAQVENLLASGNVATDIITTGNLVAGAPGTPGAYFSETTTDGIVLGQFAAQHIALNGNGISIGGTGGVSIVGAATANVTIGGGTTGNVVMASGITFLDGTYQNTATQSYSNANVAAYLASNTDPTIVDITSNIANLQSNVTSIEGNVIALQGDVFALEGNVTTLQGEVSTLQGNVTSIESNVTTLQGEVSTLQGNVTGLESNVTTLQSEVSTLQGNVTSIESNVATLQSNVATIDGEIVVINAEISAIQGNIANLEASQYSNANVAAYLPTYTGQLSGSNVTLGTGFLSLHGNTIDTTATDIVLDPLADGQPTTGNVVILGNLIVSGNTISTNTVVNVTDGLVWQAANAANTALAASGGGLAVGPVGNSYATLTFDATTNSWISSLSVHTQSNISAGGNVIGGNVIGTYLYGDGSNITGLYGNSNVAAYLASNTDPTIVEIQSSLANVNSNVFNVEANVITLQNDVSVIQGNISNLESQISNLETQVYTDANVEALLSSGNVTTNIITTGNVQGGYILGDGGLLSNIATAYGNANVATFLPTYNGNLGNVGIANTLGVLMGTPTQGNLVSNALSLTTSTALTDGIALLNSVLGKLVPPAPPAFPAGQSLSINSLTSYRMANIVQVDHTSNSYSVSPGAVVSTVSRSASYTTTTISTAGPGDSGTVAAHLSGQEAGNVTLTGNSNGTYGNLIISSNQDYHVSNSSITAGFWYVFSARQAGTVLPGWNDIIITDTAAGQTNVPSWYYDNSNPGTPLFSNASIAISSNVVTTYSSTVAHYTNATQFNIGFNVANVSGNTYPLSNTLSTGTAGGAFQAPIAVTYSQSSLASNILPAFASATVTTTSNIVSGFGSSPSGPSVSVNNSYNTGSQSFAPGATILYKTGSAGSLTFLDEGNIFVGGTIGAGVVGQVTRIVNPGSTDTPTFSGTEANFNSQTGPLETYDAAVVASVLSCNRTNYSTGYLPVGPNLSTQGTTQYFTFKFVAPSTSKFDVYITGTIAGLYVALPGSGIDTSSTLNGWLDASVSYAGAGQPGAGTGGNGSNGCALGSPVLINTAMSARRTTCTFGTTGTAASTGNEVYVRIKLTTGQAITSLAIYPASN